MPAVFLTGFPGNLGTALLENLLRRTEPDTVVVCLVQSRRLSAAAARLAELEEVLPGASNRIQVVEGDVTNPELGDELAAFKPEIREVYHFASASNLSLARGLGMRVNVDGTRHVIRFALECPNLDRLHFLSTCYVSGRLDGTFGEDDLDRGQSFNNYFEESKFLAESEVQQAMREGLSATVYRPAMVVGDSTTGATHRYDGPYHILDWVLRWPMIAPVPFAPEAVRTEFNVVPRNYVAESIAYLSAQEVSRGKVYHLSDPLPPTVAEAYEVLAQATGRKLIRTPFTPGLLKGAMRRFTPARKLAGFEPAILDYLTHPTRYVTVNTPADLPGSGISCPAFASYAGILVNYFRMHPENKATRVE